MYSNLPLPRLCAAALALALSGAPVLMAQQPSPSQPAATAASQPAPAAAPTTVPPGREGKKLAEDVFRNIQVLRGTPAEDLIQTMHVIKADLGVPCEYCHVGTRTGFGAEKDDLEPKRTARKMMRMVADINKNQFGGAPLVTCYTCHRGSAIPLSTPVLPIFFSEKEDPAPDLPSADQILSKFVQALGGEQAIRKVHSRVITGTQDVPSGAGGSVVVPSRFVQYVKAPNLILDVYHTPRFTVSTGFDGNGAWSQDMNGNVTSPLKLDDARTKRDADFYDALNLKKKYAGLSVSGIQQVNHRDAYVVVGTPEDDDPEQLYFDKLTGLLVRKTTIVETAVGDSPMEIDYQDYRATSSGVKIPFLIHQYPAGPRTELQANSTLRVLSVQDNVPIADSKFARPQSVKPQAAPPLAPTK